MQLFLLRCGSKGEKNKGAGREGCNLLKSWVFFSHKELQCGGRSERLSPAIQHLHTEGEGGQQLLVLTLVTSQGVAEFPPAEGCPETHAKGWQPGWDRRWLSRPQPRSPAPGSFLMPRTRDCSDRNTVRELDLAMPEKRNTFPPTPRAPPGRRGRAGPAGGGRGSCRGRLGPGRGFRWRPRRWGLTVLR